MIADRALLDFIYQSEVGGVGEAAYNTVFSGIRREHRPPKPLTQMTVGEVLAWQDSIDRHYNSEAAGAGQFMEDTLRRLVRKGVVSEGDRFDGATQDRLTLHLANNRGLSAYRAGRMTMEDFGTNLAKEWASLPVMKDTYRDGKFIPRGAGYYSGVGGNGKLSGGKADQFATVLTGGTFTPRRLSPDHSPSYPLRGQPGFDMPEGTVDTRWNDQPYGDPVEYRAGWQRPDVQLYDPRTGAGGVDPYSTPLQESDYRTRTGAGGGPIGDIPGWQQFADSWTDDMIVRGSRWLYDRATQEADPGFDAIEAAVAAGREGQWRYFSQARNADHFAALEARLDAKAARDKRIAEQGFWSMGTLGALASPTSLLSVVVPGGVGVAALKGGTRLATMGRAAAVGGGIEAGIQAGIEAGDSRLNPDWTAGEAVLRVGAAGALGGLLAGGVGAFAPVVRRNRLANRLAEDVAANNGVLRTSDRVTVDGRSARVTASPTRFGPDAPAHARKTGVWVNGNTVIVDEARVMERFKAGERADAGPRTATELREFEIGVATAMMRRAKGFARGEAGSAGKDPIWRLGENGPEIDRAALDRAIAAGEPIGVGPLGNAGKVRRVRVDPTKFKSAEEIEKFIKDAHILSQQARDQDEFRWMLDAQLRRQGGLKGAEAADDVAAKMAEDQEALDAGMRHLESWRKQNNRLLKERRSRILSRLQSSPYKRVHEGALSGEARDLADLLAADGAFARASDEKGVTIGPSVYSRAKTWNGIVRKLADRETQLFEKYLGFERNPQVGGISLRKAATTRRADGTPAISVTEWRRRVSKAYITGEKDEIPEIMEMVEAVRGGWAEYQGVAEETGVLGSKKLLAERAARIRERMADLDPESPFAAQLQDILDQVERRARDASAEPGEDYFTRVWSKHAIRENREAFKERIVKPWMIQQPWTRVWDESKDSLQEKLDRLLRSGVDGQDPRARLLRSRIDAAPDKGGWKWVETSTAPENVDKRADELIETILEEAEPDELAVLRDAVQPSYGKRRLFDVPNAWLLSDGPNGNGVADFIETDYLMLHKVYAERMGPAIEMARTFARPADGVRAAEGFEDAIEAAKRQERSRWGEKPGFEDHWAPMERDLRHLRDRVTNNVARAPDRWDNRTAAVLRDWSHLAYMGASALPALQDIGNIVMAHGAHRVFGTALTAMREGLSPAMKAGVEEMKKAGAILDVEMGSSLASFAETGFDPVHVTRTERVLRQAANKYFVWNGLASVTQTMKKIDAAMRVNDTLARIDRVWLGIGSNEDRAFLARFGISEADARAMREQPVMQGESGEWLANTDAWGDERLVRTFRAAIAQGSENTVLMATAADKPTMVDGVFFIRKSAKVDAYAKALGMEAEGQYWRVQSGLLALPFTFWNYGLAAYNKILVANVDEPTMRGLSGMAAIIGMAGMIEMIRSSDWDGLSAHEKMLRAVEKSGLTGAVGNAGMLMQETGHGLFGAAPLVPMERGPDGPGDALANALGAGPSVAWNAITSVATGDLSGASWSLPTRNHLLMKQFWDSAVDGLERRYSGMD